MATARELLQQADALMRRNRLREAAAAASEIPVLTDAVAGTGDELPAGSRPDALQPAEPATQAPAPQPLAGAPRAADGDVPMLTEIVEDFEPISVMGEPVGAADAEQWPDFDDDEVVVVEPWRAAGTAAAAPEEAPAPVAGDPDAARWDALAEEVRMQVLQRIDIFTDTGLQEQLTARLQPIVDRASADLVATINQQVGQLLRGYVAEAIEREIEKWRHGGS